jgi:hypothetical protein
MNLSRQHFKTEATDIWTVDEQHFARGITVDIVNQFFNPGSAFVAVARDDTHTLVGYVWAERGIKTVWSTEEMIAIKIVHVDMNLSARQRVRMVKEMIAIWELWAESIAVPIVCSSTMRGDQAGFLRLHQAAGYDCRGSICYRRLQIQSGTQGTDHSHQHADNADLH